MTLDFLLQMFHSLIFEAIFLGVKLLLLILRSHHVQPIGADFAPVCEEGSSDFAAGKVLALIQVMLAFGPRMVIHEYKLPGNSIIKVILPHSSISTNHNFIILRNKRSLIKVIAHNQLNIILPQNCVILKHSVGHAFPEFTCHELPKMLL